MTAIVEQSRYRRAIAPQAGDFASPPFDGFAFVRMQTELWLNAGIQLLIWITLFSTCWRPIRRARKPHSYEVSPAYGAIGQKALCKADRPVHDGFGRYVKRGLVQAAGRKSIG